MDIKSLSNEEILSKIKDLSNDQPTNDVSELSNDELLNQIQSFSNTNQPQAKAPQGSQESLGGLSENVVRPVARAAKSAAQGLIGGPADMVNNFIAAPVLNAAGAGANALGFDNVAEGAQNLAQRLNSPEQSASHQIEQGFSDATGGLTEARNATERVVDKAGEFVSGGALFNLGKFAGFGLESVKDLGRFAGAGGLGQAAKENGANFGGELVATIFGDIVGGQAVKGASNIAKGVAKAIKNPQELGQAFSKTFQAIKDAPYEIVGSLFRVAPENIKRDVIAAAKGLDIEAPLSSKVESPLMTFAENNWTKSALAGREYIDLLRNMNEKVVHLFKDSMDKISPVSLTEREAGIGLKSAITEQIQETRDAARELYLKVENSIPHDATWSPSNTLETIAEIKAKINTAAPSSDETQLLSAIKKIRENLFKPDVALEGEHLSLNETMQLNFAGEEGRASVARISGTRRSLNDTIDWDINSTGVSNFMRSISGALMKDLEAYGLAENPEFITNYKNANGFYKTQIGDALRSNMIKSLAGEQKPELILAKINNESSLLEVQKATGDNPKALEAFDAIKRAKVEELLTNKVIGPDGSIYYGIAANKLNDKSFDPFLKRLLETRNPDDHLYEKFTALRTFATSISKKSKELANPSGSAHSALEIARVSGFLSSLFTANPMIIGAAGLTMLSPRIVTKMITDKRFMDSVTKYIHLSPGKTSPSKFASIGRDVLLAAENMSKQDQGEEQ